MKKISIILIALITSVNSFSYETNYSPFLINISSNEVNISTGQVTLSGFVQLIDDVEEAITNPVIKMYIPNPEEQSGLGSLAEVIGLSQYSVSGKSSGPYTKGESFDFQLMFEYDILNLPANCFKLLVDLNFGGYETSEPIFVYFTPYSTVEVWNFDDFENLPRRWDFDNPGGISINRNDIPVTDLSQEEFNDETVPKSWFNIEGLAYSIPMHYIIDTLPLLVLSPTRNRNGKLLFKISINKP